MAAAAARVAATEAYYLAAKENIQTHGGMGFTWEFDCHLYYRRAKLLGLALGSTRLLEGPAGHPARDGQRAAVRRTAMDFNDTPEEAAFRAERARASSTRTPSAREPGDRHGRTAPATRAATFRERAKAWQAKKAEAGYRRASPGRRSGAGAAARRSSR